jgi:hypothetical protein
MPRKGRKLTPRKVGLALRRQRAVALRVLGYSFRQIAEALGFSGEGSAFNAIAKELADARQEQVDHLRRIEHKRIEAIILNIWPSCLGNPSNPSTIDAIKVYLGLSNRLAKLFGLDMGSTRESGGTRAEAEANVTFVQIGAGQAPRRLEDLSDDELLRLVATLEDRPPKGLLPEGRGGGSPKSPQRLHKSQKKSPTPRRKSRARATNLPCSWTYFV